MKARIFFAGIVTLGAGALYYRKRTLAPPGVVPVQPFELERYLGKWYEIARLDFRYEKHLSHTTASYTLNDDGSVRVVNRGYHELKRKYNEVVGKARLAGDKYKGQLKVSFFGPFYAGYTIVALDQDYRYALVAGRNLNYLWILSREPVLPDKVRKHYLEIASNLGFKTEQLIWVSHDPPGQELS